MGKGNIVEWPAISELPSYNLLDVVALLVVLYCTFVGWRRGLSGELARLTTLLLALLLATRLRTPLADLIRDGSRLEAPAAGALAFILIAIIVLIALSLICRLLRRVMQVTFTPGLERGGGLAAGCLRGVALVLTVFFALNLWPHDYLNRVFGQESLIGRVVQRILPPVREHWERIAPAAGPWPSHEGAAEDL